jgi:hypothetical protein
MRHLILFGLTLCCLTGCSILAMESPLGTAEEVVVEEEATP